MKINSASLEKAIQLLEYWAVPIGFGLAVYVFWDAITK